MWWCGDVVHVEGTGARGRKGGRERLAAGSRVGEGSVGSSSTRKIFSEPSHLLPFSPFDTTKKTMHPRRLALLLLAACATLAHAQKAPDDCGNAPFAACCFGNHTDAPADLPTYRDGTKISWCRGDNLICLPDYIGQEVGERCRTYPLAGCGKQGQPCCPVSSHNPTPPNKPLGAACESIVNETNRTYAICKYGGCTMQGMNYFYRPPK